MEGHLITKFVLMMMPYQSLIYDLYTDCAILPEASAAASDERQEKKRESR